MKNWYNNIMAAVDVETTGTEPGYHEILQIAVLPLDNNIKVSDEHRFFYMNVAPKHPERQGKAARGKHKLDAHKMAAECITQERAADMLNEWFNNMQLPFGKRLIPLAHNWGFERGMMTHWLGIDRLDEIFHPFPRDTMLFANMINDVYSWQGMEIPFHTVTLKAMCKRFEIPLENAHDALADCVATAALYREMIRSFG
jgi:DNA polymerase III epsilon subunit-like protein